jgi:hypothetical protein
MTDTSSYLEQTDYWTSITRPGDYPRGMGKWMLHTTEPHRLYGILREEMLAGKLGDAYSIKTKTEAPPERGAVYTHTGPYTDQARIIRLAEELKEMDRIHDFQLTGPLLYKSDLHNTWCETLARPGDRYHALLKRNWLYQFSDGELVVNAVIQALHQALEQPPENADKEFLIIRSMLPPELFAGAESKLKED